MPSRDALGRSVVSVGDVVRQDRGSGAGRVGQIKSIARSSGRITLVAADGQEFQCQYYNATCVVDRFRRASARLRRVTPAHGSVYYEVIREWRIATEICVANGRWKEANTIWLGK